MRGLLVSVCMCGLLGAQEPVFQATVRDWPSCQRAWLEGSWLQAWRLLSQGSLARALDPDLGEDPWAALFRFADDIADVQLAILPGTGGAWGTRLGIRFQGPEGAARAYGRLLTTQQVQQDEDGRARLGAWQLRLEGRELRLARDCPLVDTPWPAGEAGLHWRAPGLGLGGRIAVGAVGDLIVDLPVALPLASLASGGLDHLPSDTIAVFACDLRGAALAQALALVPWLPASLRGLAHRLEGCDGPVTALLCHGEHRLAVAGILPVCAGTDALVAQLAGRWARLLPLADRRPLPLPLGDGLPTCFVRRVDGRWYAANEPTVLEDLLADRSAVRPPPALLLGRPDLPAGADLQALFLADLQALGPACQELRSRIAPRLEVADRERFTASLAVLNAAAQEGGIASAQLISDGGRSRVEMVGLTMLIVGIGAQFLPVAGSVAPPDDGLLQRARDQLLRHRPQPETGGPLWPQATSGVLGDDLRWTELQGRRVRRLIVLPVVDGHAGGPALPVVLENPQTVSGGGRVLFSDGSIGRSSNEALWRRARRLADHGRPIGAEDWRDLHWLLLRVHGGGDR